MTDREKYNIYNEMYNKCFEYQDKLTGIYLERGYNVYCVYISVSDEETRSYFVDIEIGGSPEKYSHIRRTMTEEQLLKLMA